MKRFIVSLGVLAGALLSACTQEAQTLTPAEMSGTYDLALVKDLLFVTSSDRNELRVLSLAQAQADRRFEPAPNPLEPLSIPVLERPQALTRDVLYVDGVDWIALTTSDLTKDEYKGLNQDDVLAAQKRALVYARSNGSTQISIVATGSDNPSEALREVRRLETTEMASSRGPVTAFAALAPSDPKGQSTLYYATQETSGAKLWQATLPTSEVLLQESHLKPEEPRTPVTATEMNVPLPANVSVSSILVMPQTGVLAVATRGSAGTVGKSYRVDLQTHALTELNFGGAQVLKLVTNERVPSADPNNPQLMEGERIFGALDASSCGGQPQCTGVLVVDASTGALLNDDTGHPMLPINAGSGLPMGLSLSVDTSLLPGSSEASRDTKVPLLGIVPLSNGNVLFFDALKLVPFNVSASWDTANGQTPNTATATVSFVDTQGTSTPSTDISFQGTYGVTRNQTYQLTFEGVLPGMDFLPRTPGTATFEVPAEPRPGKGQVVQPGDIIILLPENGGLSACPDGVTVASVQTSSTPGSVILVLKDAIPAACADYTRFQVRASHLEGQSGQPFILSSSSEDYIQRMGPGETFSRNDSYFFHPEGYAGQSEGLAVSLTIGRSDLQRGEYYTVTTNSHFFPYVITVDTSLPDFLNYRLPGPVVKATVGGTDYAYVAYPSANGILQMDLTSVMAGGANSVPLFPYQ